jgi:hypothetical protein
MKDLIKLYSIVGLRTLVWKIQLLVRFVLNGSFYPTEKQRDNGTFKDYYIGWIAYKYFSKITICDGWLKVDFVGPNNDLIFTENSHGDKMTKNLAELVEVIRINNKLTKKEA